MAELEDEDRVLAVTTAAWLRMALPLHLVSVALGAVAIAMLAHAPLLRLSAWCWGVVVLAGIIAWLYAARCRFDAEIFARWGSLPGGPDAEELAAFDRALARLRGCTPVGEMRSLVSRVQGARGLLLRQGWCVLVQMAGAVVAILMQ